MSSAVDINDCVIACIVLRAYLCQAARPHVWALNIYGTSSTIYLILFLKVISKVLFFNITQRGLQTH